MALPLGPLLVRGAAVAGLLASAYAHADLASRYGPIRTSIVSQETLFYAQAVTALIVAAAVALSGRMAFWVGALLVAAGSLAAVLLYRYVQVPAVGPLPSMYEPVWFTEKSLSAVAEAVTVLACVAHLAMARGTGRTVRAATP